MPHLTGSKETEAITWLHEAARMATQAKCHKANCGTVIVKDGLIIGEGYNAPALDQESNRMCEDERPATRKQGHDRTCCMHAEWRAILDAVRRNPEKLHGAQLYFTRVDDEGEVLRSGKPYCTVCSRLALDTGIAEFVLWHEDGVCAYPTDEYNRLSYQFYTEESSQTSV